MKTTKNVHFATIFYEIMLACTAFLFLGVLCLVLCLVVCCCVIVVSLFVLTYVFMDNPLSCFVL